jgi:acetolactate synthase-1/2/3 large subunit
VVDIPKDVTAAKCKFEYPETIQMRAYNPVIKGHLGQIKKAVHLLLEAKRPMIYYRWRASFSRMVPIN